MRLDRLLRSIGAYMSDVSQKVMPMSAASVKTLRDSLSSVVPSLRGIDIPIQPRPIAETWSLPIFRWGNCGVILGNARCDGSENPRNSAHSRKFC